MQPIEAQTKFALVLPLRIKNILEHLVQKPLEWMAFGEIDEVKEGGNTYYVVKDIHFPKQENSSGNTEAIGTELASFGIGLKKKGIDASKCRLHLHSHHNMGAFWSTTDTEQMENFKNKTFMLSLVISTKEISDWKACINIFNPMRLDISIPILTQDNITEQKELDKYKSDLEKVENIKTYTQPSTNAQGSLNPRWWEEREEKMQKDMVKVFNKLNFDVMEEAIYDEYIAMGYDPKTAIHYILEERKMGADSRLGY